jgi:hypothetical protein
MLHCDQIILYNISIIEWLQHFRRRAKEWAARIDIASRQIISRAHSCSESLAGKKCMVDGKWEMFSKFDKMETVELTEGGGTSPRKGEGTGITVNMYKGEGNCRRF